MNPQYKETVQVELTQEQMETVKNWRFSDEFIGNLLRNVWIPTALNHKGSDDPST